MQAFTVALCTILVVQVLGQGYGRIRNPKVGIHPKPLSPFHPKPLIHPKPIQPKKPMHGGRFAGGMIGGIASGLASLQGGFAGGMLPPHIRNLIGSTFSGMDMIGGLDGLPRHGGAGIGENFANGLRGGWGGDPMMPQGAAINGWVDPLQGRAFPREFNGGELIFDNDAGHYVMKSQQAAVGHDIAKASSGVGMVGVGIGAGAGMHHGIAKASSGIGMGGVGIGAGAGMHHGFAKASVGAGIGVGPLEHNIVKASGGVGMGVGGIGMGVGPVEHNFVKASSGLGGLDPYGHEVAKSGGLGFAGRPVMGAHFRSNPIHDVNKVGASGIAGIHHDPLAAQIGHGIAKQTIHESSRIINMGSNGGVSMGNPLAGAAAHGLAKESVHVAKKTLNLASGAAGMGHPRPKMLGGFGRRMGY